MLTFFRLRRTIYILSASAFAELFIYYLATADKAADKTADKAADKAADRAADKTADKAADRAADKAADRTGIVAYPVIPERFYRGSIICK
jgi:hypothetical protein